MNHSTLIASRLKVVLACVAASLLFAGCGGSEPVCTPPDEPYLSARSNEELRVPQGMTTPERSDALAIPEVRSAAKNSGRTSCLDEPPSYFRSAGTVARSPEEVIASWAQAWASREADAVLALYSTGFTAPTEASGGAAWLEQRREQVATGPAPDAMVEGLAVEPDGPDRRVAKFVQKFGANALRKELTLVRESGSWRIVEEKVAGVR
ncbi:MAG: hypothetical protein ACREV5_06475 [Steroidobacter sp.]